MGYLRKMAPKTSKSKKSKKAVQGKSVSTNRKSNPLFPSRPRNFGIGGDIRPRTNVDLSRFVKWPRYVRIQRQRAILYQRLKVPPAINQFTKTITRNQAITLFMLLNKYRPETKAVKKQRLLDTAVAVSTGKDNPERKVHVIKYGLKHVTSLIEQKKAQLVCIANDVNPLELVLCLPALCRKMDVPYMIVKDKARLGALVHQKTAAVVALTGVSKGDSQQMNLLKSLAMEQYNNNIELVRKWGGGVMGLKTQAKLDKRAKAMAIEEAKKKASIM